MESRELVADALGRVSETVADTLKPGIDDEGLTWRPDADANSIAWLVWHLARVLDRNQARFTTDPQVWTSAGFDQRFAAVGVDPSPDNSGYGHTSQEVGRVRAEGQLLAEYHSAVNDKLLAYVERIDAGELERIIDTSYDPPISVGVRMISIINDAMQHAGQAAYVRGMWERSTAAG